MKPRVWMALGAEALVFAALLFGAAGTLRWPAAWAFLALFFGAALRITLTVAREDPALLDERMKSFIQKGQPAWDRILMSAIVVLFAGWLALMGLDAVRFAWSAVPAWLQGIGAAGVAAGMWICHRAFRENTFLAPVVRIQRERGHHVVSTGPYRVVRHPLYSGALVIFPSTALMLGSWYGLAASTALGIALVIRTALEDRELRRALEAYAEYAGRVRYRVIPRVW